MIIFLYGADNYRSSRKLNEVVGQYEAIHKSGLNLKYLNLEEKNFQDFYEISNTVSMFVEKKLFILKNASSNEEFKKEFLKKIEKFADSKDVIVFYEEGEVKKDSFFKKIDKAGQSQKFEILEGRQLENWIQKEISRFGTKIENSAINKLIDFVGNDLWRMENEIQKLVAYKSRNLNTDILDEDVEILVKPKVETDVFETIDAIASKDKKRALKLLKAHLKEGDSPFYLFSMINFQFRNILIIKDSIEKGLSPYSLKGLHPYVIKKGSFLSKRFDFKELKRIYEKLFELELSLKTGKIDPEAALDLFIVGI